LNKRGKKVQNAEELKKQERKVNRKRGKLAKM